MRIKLLMISVFLTSCVTLTSLEQQALDQYYLDKAVKLAKFSFQCEEVAAEILTSRESVDPAFDYSMIQTIGVKGCGKTAIYVPYCPSTVCTPGNNGIYYYLTKDFEVGQQSSVIQGIQDSQ